jgi:hypothetical protein
MARTLRDEVGASLEAEYPRSQAYMASSILQKVARELRGRAEHAVDESEFEKLAADITEILAPTPDPAIEAALILLRVDPRAGLCDLVRRLHGRLTAGDDKAQELLDRVRATLRFRVDRQLGEA